MFRTSVQDPLCGQRRRPIRRFAVVVEKEEDEDEAEEQDEEDEQDEAEQVADEEEQEAARTGPRAAIDLRNIGTSCPASFSTSTSSLAMRRL